MLRIDPLARPHSVLTRCCTVCGTHWHAVAGEFSLTFPTALCCAEPCTAVPGCQEGVRRRGVSIDWSALALEEVEISVYQHSCEPDTRQVGASSNADKAAESHPLSRPISFALQLNHSLRAAACKKGQVKHPFNPKPNFKVKILPVKVDTQPIPVSDTVVTQLPVQLRRWVQLWPES